MKRFKGLMRGNLILALVMSLALLIPVIFMAAGCGGNKTNLSSSLEDECPSCTNNIGTVDSFPSDVTRTAAFMLYYPTEDGEPEYYAEDGTPVTKDVFQAALQAMPKDPSKSIGLALLEERPSGPLEEHDQTRAWSIGCYWFDIRWEKHYVGSCIKRDTWHLQFHIRNKCQNREIFNSHLCAWWQNGPQFGIYESTRGFCAQSRGTFTEIRGKIIGALAVVGITGTIAYIIANTAAGVTVAAFAL